MALPLVSAAQMRVADARAVALRGQGALVQSAGLAVAREALRLMGGGYGRRVAVVAGPGLNGADGRAAAQWLRGRGVVVEVYEVAHQPAMVAGFDLFIDAAFGLGCSRPYVAPRVEASTPVLCVDLPSGVDADTGRVFGSPLHATATLALGAFKYAHVAGAATHFVGERRYASLDIVTDARDALVDDADLLGLVRRADDDHKWRHGLAILAGSPRMTGAAALVAEGALSAGASMVRLTTRHDAPVPTLAPEVVRDEQSGIDPRVKAIVAGPGLGEGASEWLAPRLRDVRVPVVLDADGLDVSLIAQRSSSSTWVLTPHEGEFARLTGAPVGDDRLEAVRGLAGRTGCVVLLKGPITIIAAPSGETRVVTSGTSALATAGSGDVLSGLIGATIARGHDPLHAAALAAHLHGRAGSRLGPYARASELIRAVRTLLQEVATPLRE